MKKIAILGGGIGALATAAELTNDPQLAKGLLEEIQEQVESEGEPSEDYLTADWGAFGTVRRCLCNRLPVVSPTRSGS